MIIRLSFLLLGFLPLATLSSVPAHGDENDLPHVLLIGDSISTGYTPVVKQALEGVANVRRIKGNGQHTGTGLEKIDDWLGDTEWSLIHFNWGLWDLCYRRPGAPAAGERDKANGHLTTALEQYEENLERLVARLKETGAVLIWAHTTKVPEGEPGRFVGDDLKYNEVAERVMKRHGVAINDLNSLSHEFPADLFVGPGDVHFTKMGSEQLGRRVAELIAGALAGEGGGTKPE